VEKPINLITYSVHIVNDRLDVQAMNAVKGAMSSATQNDDADNTRVMLSLLASVERDGGQSQRRLASDLGIALGLVNAYLKRCVKKGLVKVRQAPARRYAYYLTPQGFAEKSRLTVEYLSDSFSFFRQARNDCAEVFATARALGFGRVVVAGKSDLAEIARICALEAGVDIVAIVDPHATAATFVGLAVLPDFNVAEPFDAIVVTDHRAARATFEDAVARVGADRVLVPKLLGLNQPAREEAAE
jgi:DNA-binding MarR family transcriptional regulator